MGMVITLFICDEVPPVPSIVDSVIAMSYLNRSCRLCPNDSFAMNHILATSSLSEELSRLSRFFSYNFITIATPSTHISYM